MSAADAVFEARFVGMEGGLAQLALTRVWKGMADDVETAEVAGVGPNSAGCEVAMEAGEVYVVFASREGDALRGWRRRNLLSVDLHVRPWGDDHA